MSIWRKSMASTLQTKKLFLDANCLLSLLYLRASSSEVAAYIAKYNSQVYISALTVHLTYHFGLQDGYSFKAITDLVSNYSILPINSLVVRLAQSMFQGRDFEDCLQAACAEAGQCDEILTLDKLFATYTQTPVAVTVL